MFPNFYAFGFFVLNSFQHIDPNIKKQNRIIAILRVFLIVCKVQTFLFVFHWRLSYTYFNHYCFWVDCFCFSKFIFAQKKTKQKTKKRNENTLKKNAIGCITNDLFELECVGLIENINGCLYLLCFVDFYGCYFVLVQCVYDLNNVCMIWANEVAKVGRLVRILNKNIRRILYLAIHIKLTMIWNDWRTKYESLQQKPQIMMNAQVRWWKWIILHHKKSIKKV